MWFKKAKHSCKQRLITMFFQLKKMKKTFLILLVWLPLHKVLAQSELVNVRGTLFKIMRGNDFSTHVRLDTLERKNLYALGPIADLKGEIAILNGQMLISSKNTEGDVSTDTTAQHDAAMLVFSYVKAWDTLNISEKVNGFEQLQNLIEKAAKQQGRQLDKPFPFLIKTRVQSLNYHIIDWQKGTAHTMDNHKQFALKQVLKDVEVTLLGFYSDHHHSIFTHHTTNMHIHVVSEKPSLAAHVDNLEIDGTLVILLPK